MAQLKQKLLEGHTVFVKIFKVLRRYSKTIRAVASDPYSVKASELLDILVLLFLELHTKNESILT